MNSEKKLVPNEAQLAALQRLADRCGRPWKSVLSAMWSNGKDDRGEDGALLRQVRNEFGPQWLYSSSNQVVPQSVRAA